MDKIKILITGGNGYVGNSLYNGLKDFYEVTKITRNDLDLTNSKQVNTFFDKQFYDVVIHCAVKGGSRLKEDDWSVVDDNLKMYYNLLANSNNFTKFIHFGSGAEIFSQNTPYGLSKYLISQSILDKDNFYNLRIFAVFDENELDTRFIKANIKRYIKKEPMMVYENKYMDFFYMRDLILLVKYYIENFNLKKELNCTYNDKYNLENIAKIINQLSDYRVDILIEMNSSTTNYIGENESIYDLKYEGIEKGINNVYTKIKNQNEKNYIL